MGPRTSGTGRQGKPGGNTAPAMAPRRGSNTSVSKSKSINEKTHSISNMPDLDIVSEGFRTSANLGGEAKITCL